MEELERTPIGLTSAWWARSGDSPVEAMLAPEVPTRADVVVVGAGLTGLSTAVRVAQLGMEPLVIEARRVGSGTTGRTTAKVSLLQGATLQRIRSQAGEEASTAYVMGVHIVVRRHALPGPPQRCYGHSDYE